MTIASLVVKLSANVAEFHHQMESVAKRVEQTGRRITRAGLEISKAISLPIIGAGLLAFHAALAESARHFGPLFVAFQQLKGAVNALWRDIGTALTPVFLQLIDILKQGIAWLDRLVEGFNRLSPTTRKIIVDVLLFLAALGPTIVAVGSLIRAVGAVGTAIAALTSPIGLIVVAVLGLAAAGLYVATHWEQVKLRLLLVWVAIKEAFFDGVRGVLLAINLMTGGIFELLGIMPKLRKQLDILEEKSLAKSAVKILEMEAALRQLSKTGSNAGTGIQAVTDIVNEFFDAGRVASDQMALFGASFDAAAARAQIYGAAIDKLTKLHYPLDAVVGQTGLTLREMAKVMQDAKRQGDQLASINDTLRNSLAGGLQALGQRLGQIFAGMARGFKNFGAVMEGLLGTMLETLGQTLIAYGVAGIAIKKFIKSPGAAIAAGIALTALGAALGAAAQRTLDAGSGGGESAASASAPGGSSAGGGQGQGTIYIAMPVGRRTYDYNDPAEVAAFKEFIEQLAGRNVIFIPQPV